MAAALCRLGRATTLVGAIEGKLATALLKPGTTKLKTQIRCSNIDFTKIDVTTLDKSQLTDYEISKDPKEWKFVERLLPLKVVPKPKQFDGSAPSGWIAPKKEALNLPYFVPRTKNHMQPVYLSLSHRDERKITLIKRVQGDIWQMEKELRAYLESKNPKTYYPHIASRVNEMSGQIRFRGDWVAWVKKWLDLKGL